MYAKSHPHEIYKIPERQKTGSGIRMSSEFLNGSQARKQWRDAFRIQKGNYFQPTTPYPTNQISGKTKYK